MKLTVLFILVLAAVVLSEEKNEDSRLTRSISLGTISFRDRLLVNETISGRPSFDSIFVTRHAPLGTSIFAIRGWDRQFGDAVAQIVRGGVGFSFVELELWSPGARQFNYALQLWGR